MSPLFIDPGPRWPDVSIVLDKPSMRRAQGLASLLGDNGMFQKARRHLGAVAGDAEALALGTPIYVSRAPIGGDCS